MLTDSAQIQAMKARVFEANQFLPKHQLVQLTWGNVSEIDRQLGVIVIKPSGVPYETMTAEQMVVTDFEGHVLEENALWPSSDLPTHVKIYQAFPHIKGVTHTHSPYATAFAQANRSVPIYGTTHADTFCGDIPVTRPLTEDEVMTQYEACTGQVIVDTLQQHYIDPMAIPAILVSQHGAFAFGDSGQASATNSLILEEVCRIALYTEALQPAVQRIPHYICDKHYYRKHGDHAYYGQKKE